MKKIINNYVLCVLNCALCIFLLASCTEDFKDWATPQGNAQGDAINKVAGQVNAFTDNIKYTEAADNINFIEFICADVPEDATIKFTGISVNDAASIPFTSIGNVLRVTKEDLNNAVRDAYHSMSEAEKTLKIKVYGDIIVDGTALYAEMESNEVTINYTPKPLPEEAKETAFYYVGGYNSWDLSPSNQQKLDDNGDGTYSIVLEVGDSEYFKFGPESAVMSSNWDKVLGNEVDGNEAMNGYFVVNGGAMVVANAGTYRFTLDKVNWTYSVTPYTDMLWYAGDANGWTFDPLAKWGSTYVGFYWIDAVDNESTWGFKFPTSNDWDSPCYGAGEGANSIALGGGNILLPDNKAGFYRIDVDTKTNTFAVQEITAMSIIGTVNGSWDTDTDFSWDAEKKAWVCTADLKAGEFKIRANHDWTLSWGGDVTAMTADNGANMVIDEDANYTLIFTPKANGYGTLNIVNNNNVLYYAGDANGWGHDPMQKVGDEYVGYYYIYTTDNSTTWGFKFDPSPDWSKPQYGAGAEDWSLALGGDNISLPKGYESGFYQINVNLLTSLYTLTPITAISIIGTVNGNWDTDTDLTYNADERAWIAKVTLSAGEFKFRANHDWALSWGGESPTMTSQNGANINLAEGGTYTVKFAPNADGYGTFELIK